MHPLHRSLKLPLILAIGLGNAAIVTADDSNPIDTMQVWATQINSSSVSIDKDDIESKQADHLSDLLRNVPGVDVGGAHSLNQRINIRGIDDRDLDITIDGAEQNNYMYHHMGNLLINADVLKAVDIQVGNNSVIHSGLGGSLAFETKDAKDLLDPGKKIGARVQANAASNKYSGYSLTAYGQVNEMFDLFGYFNGVSRGNPEDGAGVKSVGNDGEINNLLLKLGADLNDSNRLELSYDRYKDEGDYAPRPDMGAATNSSITGSSVYPTKFDRKTLTLGYELDLDDAFFLKATVYKNTLNLWRDEQKNDRASYRYLEGDSEHSGINILAESTLEAADVYHTLHYGVKSYEQETQLQEDSVLALTEKAKSTAVYLEDEIALTERFSITPGLRYDNYKLETTSTDKTYTETTAALAMQYQVNDSWSVHASSTQLFKGPELSEVFTQAGSTLLTNENLKAETGLNNEIGFKFSETGAFGLDKLSFGVNAFHTKIDDYIAVTTVSRGPTVTSRKNEGKYTSAGFEANMVLKKGRLGAQLSYASSRTKVNSSGDPLDRELGDSISLALDYEFPEQDISVSWTSLVALKESHFDKPSYNVHNISAKWTPKSAKGFTLSAGIENLFDKRYTSHASQIGDTNHPVFGDLHLNDYEPGRNIKLSASYRF